MGKRLQLIKTHEAPSTTEDNLWELVEDADRKAIQRVLDGDVEAFGGVVQRHGRRLMSLCARMVGDPHIGEELAQETLARVYADLGSWRGACRFRHWLSRVAINCCRDFLKAGARLEQPTELTGEELVHSQNPENQASDRQLMHALEQAVRRLPEMYREAFVLFHVENMDYQHMSDATGQSVGALKVRVHRARLLLRDELGDLLNEVVKTGHGS